jgi:hypothetical protein
VFQRIFVRTTRKGVTETTWEPPNAKMAGRLATARAYPNPPEYLVRHFHFTGAIPAEYQWIVDDKSLRIATDIEFSVALSFDEWAAVAARENACSSLHALPEWDDEEEDEEAA